MSRNKPTEEHLVAEAITGLKRIDRVKRVIFGVKVLGSKSLLGRLYLNDALNRDYGVFEGAKVFLGEVQGFRPTREGLVAFFGHHRRAMKGSKPPTPLIGVLKNVKPKSDGVYGNLEVAKGKDGDLVLDSAEANPDAFGLSYVGRVRSGFVPDGNGGRTEVVSGITDCQYVEAVSIPATARNLYEGLAMEDTGAAAVAAEPVMGLEEAIDAGFKLILNSLSSSGDIDESEVPAMHKDLLAAKKKLKEKWGLAEPEAEAPADGEGGDGAATEGVSEEQASVPLRPTSVSAKIDKLTEAVTTLVETIKNPPRKPYGMPRSAGRVEEGLPNGQQQKPKPPGKPFPHDGTPEQKQAWYAAQR